MLVQMRGRETSTFRPVKYVSPTAIEMGELAGDYYSEELQATYKIAVEDGKLVVNIKNSPKAVLYPTVRDEFRFSGNIVIFSRDAQNRVTGFSLNSGRIRGIGFVKRKGTPN